MEDSVPFLEMLSDPVPLFAQDTRLGAGASSLPRTDRKPNDEKDKTTTAYWKKLLNVNTVINTVNYLNGKIK